MDKNNSLIELPTQYAQLPSQKTLFRFLAALILGIIGMSTSILFWQHYLWAGLGVLASLQCLWWAWQCQRQSYHSIQLSEQGILISHIIVGATLIPWSQVKGFEPKKILTKSKLPDLHIQHPHAKICISLARRYYYADAYRPLLKRDFVDVENLPFDDDQLQRILLHLYHQGWGDPYEWIDLYQNTLYFDNGHNAKCIQAIGALHFLRQGLDTPRYLRLITDVRGGLEILVTHLPASLRESLPLEILSKTPRIYSENTMIG